MDMRTTIPQWLKNETLEKRGGSYTNTIAAARTPGEVRWVKVIQR